jgi:hypothetical protein
VKALKDVLSGIDAESDRDWLYLPSDEKWHLESRSTVLTSEEVPPAQEDEPDAGVPLFAKENRLMRVLPIGTVKEIVANAKAQRPRATSEELFKAFLHYYDNDAFISFENN